VKLISDKISARTCNSRATGGTADDYSNKNHLHQGIFQTNIWLDASISVDRLNLN